MLAKHYARTETAAAIAVQMLHPVKSPGAAVIEMQPAPQPMTISVLVQSAVAMQAVYLASVQAAAALVGRARMRKRTKKRTSEWTSEME